LTQRRQSAKLAVMIRLFIVLLSLAFVATAADRDAKWAAKLEQAGLPNLHRVTDNLYRCAQPTADGMRAAEKLGIKTIVNLRGFHSDKDEVSSTKLRSERIVFHTWHAEDEDVVKFLKIVTDTNAGPILVHCQHGADRTGTMIAIYRMAVQGWKKEDAIKEMKEGGYGYHSIWTNLVRYLNGLDVQALKRKAGLK
jgi:protein tyrosine/serine phosphatase